MRRLSAVVVVLLSACLDTELSPPPGAGSLTGRVLVAMPGEPLGAPVSGATVVLVESGQSTSSDADGRFALSPIAAESSSLEISYGNLKRVLSLQGLGAGPGRAVSLGDVALSRNASAQGEVLLAGSGTLEGTLVFLEGQLASTYTTPSGAFVLRELPVGPNVLSVYRRGYAPAQLALDLRAGERTFIDSLTLTPMPAVTPRALGRALLDGRDDASTVVISADGVETAASATGEWSLQLPPGVHSFTFRAPGRRSVTLVNRLIVDGDVTLPDVTLFEGEGGEVVVTPFPAFDGGLIVDGGADAGEVDAGSDAGLSMDAGLDAGFDAGFDAGVDAGTGDGGVPVVATRVVASISHACALLSDGRAFCWGRDTFGQILGPPGADALPPTLAATDVIDLAPGGTHSCAVHDDAGLECWGTNTDYQLGVLNTASTRAKPPLPGRSVTSGARFSCAVTAAQVQCWGANDGNQTGTGLASLKVGPGNVYNVTLAEAVAAGDAHVCILMTVNGSPSVKCAGSPFATGSTPGGVVLTDVRQLASGGAHTCAVKLDGTVYCWGAGGGGQLGFTPASMTPTLVSGLSNVRSITAGGQHTCALLNDGTLSCWGGNAAGQLGNGSFDGGIARVSPALTQVVSVAAGGSSTCALQDGGAIFCWGDNTYGQLGSNAGTSSNVPVRVPLTP